MNSEEILLQIKELCGGPSNINLADFKENTLNLTVKDRSLVNLVNINQLEDVRLAELTNSRVKVILEQKSEELRMEKKKLNYDELAKTIISNVGGKENINGLRHCITRVRFDLKDEGKANDEVLKNTEGVISVIKSGGEYMVVIGNQVTEVYDAINAQLGIKGEAIINKEKVKGKQKNPIMRVLNTVVGAIMPALNLICAGGILKGLLTILSMTGVVPADSGMYLLINGMGDAVFFFLPIILGYNLAKHLGGEPFLGLVIGATLCYPALNGVDINIFGMTVNSTYTSSFLPVVMITAIAIPLSKMLNKFIPKVVAGFLTPVITLLIVIPLGFVIVGPAASALGMVVNNGTNMLLNVAPVPAGMIFSALYQVLVLFGIHSAMLSFSFMNVLSGTPESLMAMAMFPSFAQTGVVLAILLRTKDMKLKSVALPAFISGIFGITEPAIYGVTLPRIKYFVISCIGAMTSGVIVMLTGTKMYSFSGMGVFAILGIANPENPNFLPAIMAAIVPFVVSFVIAFVMYKDDKQAA